MARGRAGVFEKLWARIHREGADIGEIGEIQRNWNVAEIGNSAKLEFRECNRARVNTPEMPPVCWRESGSIHGLSSRPIPAGSEFHSSLPMMLSRHKTESIAQAAGARRTCLPGALFSAGSWSASAGARGRRPVPAMRHGRAAFPFPRRSRSNNTWSRSPFCTPCPAFR